MEAASINALSTNTAFNEKGAKDISLENTDNKFSLLLNSAKANGEGESSTANKNNANALNENGVEREAGLSIEGQLQKWDETTGKDVDDFHMGMILAFGANIQNNFDNQNFAGKLDKNNIKELLMKISDKKIPKVKAFDPNLMNLSILEGNSEGQLIQQKLGTVDQDGSAVIDKKLQELLMKISDKNVSEVKAYGSNSINLQELKDNAEKQVVQQKLGNMNQDDSLVIDKRLQELLMKMSDKNVPEVKGYSSNLINLQGLKDNAEKQVIQQKAANVNQDDSQVIDDKLEELLEKISDKNLLEIKALIPNSADLQAVQGNTESLEDQQKINSGNYNSGLVMDNKLKELLEKIMNNNVPGVNSINLNQVDLQNAKNTIGSQVIQKQTEENRLEDLYDVVNTDNLLSQLLYRVATDDDFKTKIIQQINENIQKSADTKIPDLTEYITNKLSSIPDNTVKEELNEKETVLPINYNVINKRKADAYKTENVNAANKVLNEGKHESNITSAKEDFYASGTNKALNTQLVSNANNEGEKFLKHLLSDDNTKNSKDIVNDKISNYVARFEAANKEMPANIVEKVTINREKFNEDFIKTVKYMEINNVKELSVKVAPGDLGEITIRLSMDNGAMKANISASNKETFNLLNMHLPDISTQLTEQNMSIQSFSLSLSNGDGFLFSGNRNNGQEERKQSNRGPSVEGIEENNTVLETNLAESSNVNALV